MRFATLLFLPLALYACGPRIKVVQPVVVGSPGVVYQSTEAENSIDVINNTTVAGDVMMGDVVLYKDLRPRDVKNVGFFCPGIRTYETARHRVSRDRNRNDVIYFKPYDERYQVVEKSVSVVCQNRGSSRKSRFEINNLRRLRTPR